VLSALHVQTSSRARAALLVFTHEEHGAFGPREIRLARRFAPPWSLRRSSRADRTVGPTTMCRRRSGPAAWARSISPGNACPVG
jgi:hypothetical protein